MSHQHEHHHHDSAHSGHAHAESKGTMQQGKWFVIAVVLMLLGMIMYMLSMDEAVEPDGETQPAVPEAAL